MSPSGSPPPYSEMCFAIGKSKNWKYYQMHQGDKDGPVVYNAVIHNWSRGKPTVELHKGASESDPIVAFSGVNSSGCGSQLAIGDPAMKDTGAISYDGFTDAKAYHFKEFRFETDELNEKRQRHQYTWIRTQHHPGRFECRDLTTGEVLSEFRSNGFWKWTKIGHIYITQPNVTERAVQYLLLVFLTWSEMENREQATIAAVS